QVLGCADVSVAWQRDLDYDAKGCGRKVSLRCDKDACRALGAPTMTTQDMPPDAVLATKSEPPAGCVAKGVAEGEDRELLGAKYEVALEQLRKNAYERGANYVTLDEVRGSGSSYLVVGGRLFKCPTEATTQTSASSSSCTPDCSPGFVCIAGKCVSAC